MALRRMSGNTGFEGGTGGIGEADGAVLEAGVDAGFLNLANQLFIEALIGVGFLLERPVFEGTGVELVELGFGVGHGGLEHGLAIDGFLIVEAHALADARLQAVELAFQFGELRIGFLVLGMGGAVLGFDGCELFAGFINAVGEAAKLIALSGGQRGIQRTALYGIEAGLLPDTVGLGVGELGVELKQARREDAGLLLRIDDTEVLLESDQGGGGALHLGLEFLHLLFHELREAGSGIEADVVCVQDVAVGDGIGDVCGQLGIG
jgi:hypothetical protein